MIPFTCRPRLQTVLTVYILISCSRAMGNENDRDREHDIQEKILSQIQASGLVRKKELTAKELQRLKSAATRLERMLNSAADADRESLKSAAARLEQLLADLSTGKDVTQTVKRRPGRQHQGE